MKQKFKILLVFISLSLTLSLMSNTYSRYAANTTGNVQVLFANWQILVNETDITNSSESTIVLEPIMDENAHVASNTIAPSSKGHFDIDIDPTNVGVSFNYTITLDILNENMPDLMITKYSILDSNYTEGAVVDVNSSSGNEITGSFDYNKEKPFEPFTIRVYFEWYDGMNEEMDDTKDSEIGYIASQEELKLEISATIAFEQKISASE